MARAYNFSAGPAMLPAAVLTQAREEMSDWHQTGMSIMEMSHRSKAFVGVAEKAEADLRTLMAIPDNYKVLFLQGGASLQFAMAPLNLLGETGKADYINTGMWSKKAIAEGKRYGDVQVAASSEDDRFCSIPAFADWSLRENAAFVHYTPNETIGGVEFHWTPDCGDTPLVADMSSTILSRPIDVSRFGVIYAGAQKNIGPAGLTVVIIRDDLLGGAHADVPAMLNYQTHANTDSMYHTPPTYSWYLAGLVFEWLKAQGGLTAMAARNQRKSEKLYAAIDASGGFYHNPVRQDCRSWMNIPFTLADSNLDSAFLTGAAEANLQTLKGHRSIGGMRASIYNAMPEEGVDALVAYMDEFQRSKG